jgi:hypothetical protein
MVHQRRALKLMAREIERLQDKLRASQLLRADISRQLGAAHQRLQWHWARRLFGWHVHIWKNGNTGWWDWKRYTSRRNAVLLRTLRSHGYHAGGCGKFDADNRFNERGACTCGLTAALENGGTRCRCVSCRTQRTRRHERLMQPVSSASPSTAQGEPTP